MSQREVKFHNVTPTEILALRDGIHSKYPDQPIPNAGEQLAIEGGFKLCWQYVGTDLVVTLDGMSLLMGTARTRLVSFVLGIIGEHGVD